MESLNQTTVGPDLQRREPAAADARVDLARLSEPAVRVDEFLAGWLEQRPLPAKLREAVRYAVLAPGKRIRPLLVSYSSAAVGGRPADATVPAAAIEMVHAHSLVHDDLPAMDDDDLRRGRPTLHCHTSEAMALLAGDSLLGLALELVLERVVPPPLAARIGLELTRGCNNMIAGQVYDTVPGSVESGTALERLEVTHRHKTGALIRAACRMGGLVGGADEKRLAALTTYGETVGHMFQVVDDLLDVTQTTEQLGKTAGKDVDQAKLTYPSLLGVEKSRAEARRLRDQALSALEAFDERADPLRQLCRFLTERTH